MQISLNYPNNQLLVAMVLVGLKMTAIDFYKLDSNRFMFSCRMEGSVQLLGLNYKSKNWKRAFALGNINTY